MDNVHELKAKRGFGSVILVLGTWLLFNTSCLDQELDSFTITQVNLLLSGSNIIAPKPWKNDAMDGTLVFRRSTNPFSFLLRTSTNDTIAYGTWRLSQTIRGEFTDTIYMDYLGGPRPSPFQDYVTVQALTSQRLKLYNQQELFEFLNTNN